MIVCPKCNFENIDECLFCGKCGEKLSLNKKKYCTQCGSVLSDVMKFCTVCGACVNSDNGNTISNTDDKSDDEIITYSSQEDLNKSEQERVSDVQNSIHTDSIDASKNEELNISFSGSAGLNSNTVVDNTESNDNNMVNEIESKKIIDDQPKVFWNDEKTTTHNPQNEINISFKKKENEQGTQTHEKDEEIDNYNGSPLSLLKKENIDFLSYIIFIIAGIFLIMFITALFTSNGIAGFLSILQLCGISYVYLIKVSKVRPQLPWIKYAILAGIVLCTVLNFSSYSWRSINQTIDDTTTSTIEETITEIPTALIPLNSYDLNNLSLLDAKKLFRDAGFTNIKLETIDDVKSNEKEKLDSIGSITIDGKSDFTKDTEIKSNSKVVIKYHAYAPCNLNIHVDFISNLIFNRYDVELKVDDKSLGKLKHGEDVDTSTTVLPGEHVISFISCDSSSITGSGKLEVKGDTNISLQIICYGSEISIDVKSLEDFGVLSDNEFFFPKNSSQYSNKDYKDVENEFKEMGFSNIKLNPQYDIYWGITTVGSVSEVSIAGNSKFSKGDVFSKDSEVVITYHLNEKDNPNYIPISNDYSYKNKDYTTVKSEFESLGFTDIELEPYDTEYSSDDKKVKSVSIGGDSYIQGYAFLKTSKVIIKYWKYDEKLAESLTSNDNSSNTVVNDNNSTNPPPKNDEPSNQSNAYSVDYSTNDSETVKNGDSGIYSYKSRGGSYDIYFIIDFNEGFVYNFNTDNGDCYKVKIDSGTLNDVVIVTYHADGITWQEGLHFKYSRNPEHLIMEDNDHFTWDYYPTDLNNALALRDTQRICNY